jgi:WS/DGAT C-terminal domain
VAAVFCPLPVQEADPLARLRKVSDAMKGLKESRQAVGAMALACHPVVPLTTTTTISVALLSYDGSIDIGLLGDAEHAADLPELKRAIPIALAALSKGAGALKPSRGRGPRS